MKIGDRFWVKQANKVWFEERVIVGETSRSWVCIPMEKDFEKYRDSEWWIKQVAVKLPKNFKSWIAYRDFLLKTHPDQQRVHLFVERFARHLVNEYVARQQCRQLILNDYENNLPIDNKPDPRDELVRYYDEVL